MSLIVLDWILQILSTKIAPQVMLDKLSIDSKRPEPQFELPLKQGLQLQELFQACEAFSWWKPSTTASRPNHQRSFNWIH